VNSMRLRSWTVPKGGKFVCVPQDGSGPFIAEAGAQVVIVGRDTWEQALREAMEELAKGSK
jgi:hypothetical protein